MSAAGGGDGHDSGDADGVPAKGSGSLKAPVATTLFVTFGFLGFGTGWSSQDSIFQQVDKYTAEYDDLTFAGELVLLSNLAAAITLALTFSGLYLAPGGVELRTVRFFEATITSVLAASCGVQITMATSWNVSKRVVEACALVAGVIGDLQAFIVYPFFNAFYRTNSSSALMNLGETRQRRSSRRARPHPEPHDGRRVFLRGRVLRRHLRRHRLRGVGVDEPVVPARISPRHG